MKAARGAYRARASPGLSRLYRKRVYNGTIECYRMCHIHRSSRRLLTKTQPRARDRGPKNYFVQQRIPNKLYSTFVFIDNQLIKLMRTSIMKNSRKSCGAKFLWEKFAKNLQFRKMTKSLVFQRLLEFEKTWPSSKWRKEISVTDNSRLGTLLFFFSSSIYAAENWPWQNTIFHGIS